MIDKSADKYLQDPIELDLNAYNAAFYQLGLRWYWDREMYDRLREASEVAAERVGWYLRIHQAHLLTAYDADFLVAAIETAKTECRKAVRGSPSSTYFNWAEIRAAELGV